MKIIGISFSSLITETQLSFLEPLDLNREDSPDSRELPIEVRMAVGDKQVNTLFYQFSRSFVYAVVLLYDTEALGVTGF
jgi:hypothetical protein